MRGWRGQLQALWFRPRLSPLLFPLLPVAAVYAGLAALRRALYRHGILPSAGVDRPLVVVGNITVGGSGKTPLVIWLVEALRAAGHRPGVISRGFGGSGAVQMVGPASDPAAVGDEPCLIAARGAVPVQVGRDRVAAARALLAACPDVDVIICDDGLQHYRLRRELELVVVDGRGFGNRYLLPMGPLREPVARLATVAALVVNGRQTPGKIPPVDSFAMTLDALPFRRLDDPACRCNAVDFAGRPLCAIAGIGDPGRFFDSLRRLGLSFEARAFPDHHRYVAADLDFAAGRVLLMTEKDAVKCAGLFAGEAWVLPVGARIEPDLATFVLEKLFGHKTA